MKTLPDLEALSNDELRVMLGKIAGWTFRYPGVKDNPYTPHWANPNDQGGFMLPNFPLDLNAVDEVEKKLTIRQKIQYLDDGVGILPEVVGDDNFPELATARQRTIALILTLQQP